MDERKVKVLVVDDHLITRQYFEATIRSSVRYELLASLPLAQEAVEYCRSHAVELVVMDVLMQHGVDGLTAAGIIKKEHPETKIVLATSTAEAKWLKEAQDLGIEALWYKNYGESPLLEVMDRVMAGDTFYLDETENLTLGNAKKADLTERELDVLRELVACYTTEQIADRLSVSVNTVKMHIRHLLEKTGFSDRLELAIHASKNNLVVSDRERQAGDPNAQ
ncbi:MAG: response regulator transcription factor [Lachnospiraceae bacterium]|nr:response regulator transcription factor [Lachnospiraceae bacterium]